MRASDSDAARPSGSSTMPIQVTCPSCARQASVPDSAAGKSVRCQCGASFPVPTAQPAEPEDDASRLAAMRDKALKQGLCPVCGAKWPKIGKKCGQCNWNAATGTHVASAPKRPAPSARPLNNDPDSIRDRLANRPDRPRRRESESGKSEPKAATNSGRDVSVTNIIIALVIICAGGYAALNAGMFRPAGNTENGRIVIPEPLLAPPPVVTKAEFDQIADGMTYEQVCQIIGVKGDEISRSNIAEITTVMYQWVNPSGSNMNAMFQNGRLISKAQFGLP